MAEHKYYLNDALKARAAREQKSQDGEIHLDDVSRVKVLSPGLQVFKRFVRNRLAVFGSILLITMFVFSFLGPLVYPYGQKQIFYKYARQTVNDAMAKDTTAYNGYVSDESAAERQQRHELQHQEHDRQRRGKTHAGGSRRRLPH